MRRVKSVARIQDPYVKRILSNIIGMDAFKVYRNTPRVLRQLTRGLSRSLLRKQVVKGRWSIAQIVSHLCDSELVMGFRCRMAVAQSSSPLQAFDERKWAKHLRYEASDPAKRLELFITMRNDNVALLQSLSREEWKRFGIHEERGKETVERMVQMMAGHDINHLRQVQNIRTMFSTKR